MSTSIGYALRALLLLRERESVRVGELAQELEVAPSTAHRVLATLRAHGFAEQIQRRGGYQPGPMLTEISFAALRGYDLKRIARPHLESVSGRLDATANLCVLEGDQCRFLDSVEATTPLRVASRAGWALPAHCTSGGKALLAALPREQRDRILPEGDLFARTTRSITSRELLEAELAEITERGFSTCWEESEIGISAVAVTVRGPAGVPDAALTVSVPTSLLDPPQLDRYADALHEAARRIERVGAAVPVEMPAE
jgi:DNA-binding IclR family transcriptional regulator